MTIANQNKRISHNGDGSTLVFAFNWLIQATDEITVVLKSASGTETVQTETTHYSVSGLDSDSGGSVTMVTAPAVGETLSLFVDPDLTQETAFTSGGAYDADAHENALDYQLNLHKRTRDLAERSLTLGDGDVAGSGEYDAGSNKITNLGTGSADGDAASVQTVNALIAAASVDTTESLSSFLGALIYDNGATNATDYSALSRLRAIKPVQDWGALGDGSTDDSAAFTSAATDATAGGYEVYVPDTGSAYIVATQPSVSLFWGPGKVQTSGGVQHYVKPYPGELDGIHLGQYDINFAGGADAATEFQAAVDLANSTQVQRIILPPRAWIRLDSTITFEQGLVVGGVARDRSEPQIIGNHATIFPNVDGPCFQFLPQAAWASSPSGEELGTVHIENLRFDGNLSESAGHTNTQAMVFGRADYKWSSNAKSKIENVQVLNFNGSITAYSVSFRNVRNFDINGLTFPDGGGCEIVNLNSDIDLSFCGDLWFNACDLRGTTSSPDRRPIYIHGANTTNSFTANCEGIHFNSCFFYTGGVLLSVGADDAIRHVYFNDCYMDTPASGDRGIEILCSSANGQVDRVFLNNFDATVFDENVLRVANTGGAAQAVRQIHVNGMNIITSTDGTDTDLVYFDDCDGVILRGLNIEGTTDSGSLRSLVYLNDCRHTLIDGLIALDQLPSGVDAVQFAGASDDWIVMGVGADMNGGTLVNDNATGSGTTAATLDF